MFNEVKKNFGFGCMRLPMNNEEVDLVEFTKMVDYFMEAGFNYFDTAHVYIGGKSELALRECLVNRYPRDSFILTNKLSGSCFKVESDLEEMFNMQLKSCGVEYFDFYLMHAQNASNFARYKKEHAYEFAFKMKEEGKIKHVGLSFHDSADVLDQILTEYPNIEVVQIQFNYLDYLDPLVQGKLCYEVCRKHNKPIIVMEPVKGGKLANLPSDAKKILDDLNNGTPASYAIRYVAGHEGIFMTLSGMSNMEQMIDNVSYMKNFIKINETEQIAITEVVKILTKLNTIECTNCRYCIDGCPKKILIPNLFACLNSKILNDDWNSNYYYNDVYTVNNGKAKECIECGKCENICPQHLEIRKLLKRVSKVFDK